MEGHVRGGYETEAKEKFAEAVISGPIIQGRARCGARPRPDRDQAGAILSRCMPGYPGCLRQSASRLMYSTGGPR